MVDIGFNQHRSTYSTTAALTSRPTDATKTIWALWGTKTFDQYWYLIISDTSSSVVYSTYPQSPWLYKFCRLRIWSTFKRSGTSSRQYEALQFISFPLLDYVKDHWSIFQERWSSILTPLNIHQFVLVNTSIIHQSERGPSHTMPQSSMLTYFFPYIEQKQILLVTKDPLEALLFDTTHYQLTTTLTCTMHTCRKRSKERRLVNYYFPGPYHNSRHQNATTATEHSQGQTHIGSTSKWISLGAKKTVSQMPDQHVKHGQLLGMTNRRQRERNGGPVPRSLPKICPMASLNEMRNMKLTLSLSLDLIICFLVQKKESGKSI